MAEWFASGRLIDLVLALVAVEAVLLLAWRRRAGHGPAPASLVANLASGACLMLALRAALTGADWRWLALALVGSLIAHLADLGLRLGAAPPTPAAGPPSRPSRPLP
ncbi:hypothetical protein OPKNFCMD_4392 [Methylobacterium crusticola]|uniref:Uncharacterized protein n=1 Tax=Methylobacterium crusticola TaxID=1697972 RepID=A0ABQ4R4H6_9HYPH|nr:hypothetical protein [Methylobacterium crusticola]GJD51637.1 hypothetical protein OPKNFCMD_4392 [Methylobacterium crusticola]